MHAHAEIHLAKQSNIEHTKHDHISGADEIIIYDEIYTHNSSHNSN